MANQHDIIPGIATKTAAWDSLTQEQKDYASRLLAVRAGMIENIDQNIGKLIDHLKQTGEYDNTLIVFTSDNGGSEASSASGGHPTLQWG